MYLYFLLKHHKKDRTRIFKGRNPLRQSTKEEDKRCQQNLGSWKVSGNWSGGSEKAGNSMPARSNQCCASEAQKDSGIGGASYIRRQGGVGLKTGSMVYLQST